MDVGYGVLWKHQPSLAAGYYRPSAHLPGAYWLFSRALEAKERHRDTGASRFAAWAIGLPFVSITTDPDNVPSRRVIEANGGILFEEFITPPQCGSTPAVRYRIYAPGHGG